MYINEKKLRLLIRKRLINEIAFVPPGQVALAGAVLYGLNFIDSELFGASGDIEVEKVLNFPGNQLLSSINATFKAINGQRKKIDPKAEDIKYKKLNDSDQNIYAEELESATHGGADFGFLTDKEAISDVFKQIDSLINIAYTGRRFYQNNQDNWVDSANLYKVLKDELDEDDFRKHVTDILKNKPIVIIGDKPYPKDEFEKYLKDKEYLDDLKDKKETISGDKLDPSTLTGNIVSRIQQVLNKYKEKYNLSGESIAIDGKWGGKTDVLWGIVTRHVFSPEGHPEFKEFKDRVFGEDETDIVKWKSKLSPILVGQYPGYTPDPTGCLLFLVDCYNGDTTYGSGSGTFVYGGSGKKTTKGTGGGSSRGATRGSGSQKVVSGSGGSGDITIITRMAKGQDLDTLEKLGYLPGTTSELEKVILEKIRSFNYSGGVINLKVVVRKNGSIAAVRKARGQRGIALRPFESIKSAVKTYLNSKGDDNKVDLSKLKDPKGINRPSFELVITVGRRSSRWKYQKET